MAMEITTTVAVLGAGWAGVSAGYELSQAGLQDFVMVEGGNHIGGRSRKFDFGDGYVVEDGSNWVQGIGSNNKMHVNPIWELAERYGLSKIKKKKHPFKNVGEGSIQQNYESYVIYDENGLPIADKDIRWGDMETASNCVVNTAVELNLAYWQYGSVQSPIPTQRQLLEQCGWAPMSPVDDVIEWWDMDWEWGGEPDFGSGYEVVWGYQDYDEEDEFVIDQRGFQYLAEQLAGEYLVEGDERLMMNTVVTNINYEPESCPPEFASTGCVKITTNQGATIVAQYAIVTFSSAVILEGHNTLFSPPLPDINREAMASVSPGVYTKVFFQFPEKFWEDTQFIVTATHERGASPLWQNLDSNKLLEGSRIIFQTLTGDMGARAELSDDETIKQEQLSYLRNVYGDAVPEPTAFHIARFLSDPLFKQSWADWTPDTIPDVCDRMRAPILNSRQERNIYMSGEATCRRYHGYTHGGLLSGRRDARDVLIALNYNVEREDACENEDKPSAGPPYGNQGNGSGNQGNGNGGGNGKGNGNK